MSDIRMLEELGAEFERVTAVKRRRRRWPIVGLVLVIGIAAAPPTRAGIDELAGWLDGGRPAAPGEHVPIGMLDASTRVLAESEGAKLYMSREGDYINVMVGDGFGEGADVKSWSERFAQHAVIIMGPASVDGQPWDARGRFPLMGLTSREVTRVEVVFGSGAPDHGRSDTGGFVVWVDARRPLREVVGYDASGRVVERASARHIDLSRVCRDARGCPPGKWDRP